MPRKVSILVSFSGKGGVERMIANLCHGFLAHGYSVDLLLIKARGPHMTMIPPEVNIIRLGSQHAILCLWSLMCYFRAQRPPALLVTKHRAKSVALLARMLSGVDTRIVLRISTHVSRALSGKGWLHRMAYQLPLRWLYPRADVIVAVSDGVARDIGKVAGVSPERVRVIPNPVIVPGMAEKAALPVEHRWFVEKTLPVVLGIGRLAPEKDFATLLRAFAEVRARTDCRLVILGEGRERKSLENLAEELEIVEHISLPGFVANPYAYLARADVFVLSSLYEGSPNALTEAMALGTPVVATDCRSGPREITRNGVYGKLVPVRDSHAMAQAVLETLQALHDPARLRAAVAEYAAEVSAYRFLDALGLESDTGGCTDPVWSNEASSHSGRSAQPL
jgi:glycosyltransferase involved in cell wall biosynthesis